MEIPIIDPDIDLIKAGELIIRGKFSPRGSHIDKQSVETYLPKQTTTVKIPLPYILRKEEVEDMKQQGYPVIGESTFVLDILFPKDILIPSYLAPYISITLPDEDVITKNKDFFAAARKLLLVKEIISLAISDFYLDEMIGIMQEK